MAKPPPVAKLPSKLTLPSGAVVQLRTPESSERGPLSRKPGAPLFDEVLEAFSSGRVTITKEGSPLDLESLALRDFHVLRAVLTRSGVIAEEEIEVSCRNCQAPMHLRPCAALEIGPWIDGELDDPELDSTLPFGEPIDVPPMPLGRVRMARTVTFEDRTVKQARALFVAVAQPKIDVNEALVRAMGIVAVGAERDKGAIATSLEQCDDDAFHAVGGAFIDSHYAPRLGCIVLCEACGARNDVDAPYEREVGGGSGAREGEYDHEDDGGEGALPELDAFAARAHEIAHPLLEDLPGDPVELVIEGGTPAVDDGGEPLLGSYVPPHPGDAGTPTQAPVVTVYYKTFRAMWDEEGPFDWDGELTETIEHELEHHVSYMRGDDPMDDEERDEIRAEAVRVVGRRETGRRAMQSFGASWADFFRRTWPVWVLALLALAFMLATQR